MYHYLIVKFNHQKVPILKFPRKLLTSNAIARPIHDVNLHSIIFWHRVVCMVSSDNLQFCCRN